MAAPSPALMTSKISMSSRRFDAHKLHAITGSQKKDRTLTTGRIEQRRRGVADDVPSARTIHGVDAGMFAANRDRACAHADPWRDQTRRVQTRIQVAQIRKARREAEHVNFVD